MNKDIEITPMQYDFLEESWLKEQPREMYRLDRSGHRYYYTYKDGKPVFFVSVTTFIKQSLPTSPHLIKWLVDQQGKGEDVAKDRAEFGTFLHIQCGELMTNAKYDLDSLDDKLMDYIEEHHLDKSFMDYTFDLKKDVLAFAQWMIDFNVTPLAIELVLGHDEWGVAGAIDIICEMDYEEKGYFGEMYKSGPNKGKPKITKQAKRVIAIVDVKSGRKGFYESHEIQLHAYKGMVEYNFPDIKIDHVFNWSPKDWRGDAPTYNFKCQTYSKAAAKLKPMLEIARIEDASVNNSLTMYKGEIDLAKGLMNNIETKTLTEIVSSK